MRQNDDDEYKAEHEAEGQSDSESSKSTAHEQRYGVTPGGDDEVYVGQQQKVQAKSSHHEDYDYASESESDPEPWPPNARQHHYETPGGPASNHHANDKNGDEEQHSDSTSVADLI